MDKNLTSELWKCINNSADYSFASDPLPVFYILYACYCRVGLRFYQWTENKCVPSFNKAVFSEDEWDSARELYLSLESKTKESVLKHLELFEKMYNTITSNYGIIEPSGKYDYDKFASEFKEILDFFVEKYLSARNVIRPADPRGYHDLISRLISTLCEERYLYDFGSSCGSMVLEKNKPYIDDAFGYESDDILYTISQLRVKANHLSLDSVTNEDPYALKNWQIYSFTRFDPEFTEKALDEYFYTDKYEAAVFTLPAEFCYGPKYADYRAKIREKGILEYVIYLPAGAFIGCDRESVIIGLSEWGAQARFTSKGHFTIIDGRKILKAGKIDYDRIGKLAWNIVDGRAHSDGKNPAWLNLKKDEASGQHIEINLLPSFWFDYYDRLGDDEDYQEYTVGDLCEGAQAIKDEKAEAALVVTDEDLYDVMSCDEFIPGELEKRAVPDGYTGFKGKCLVMGCRDGRLTFRVIDSDEVFYTAPDKVVLSAKESVDCNWEYVCRSILSVPVNCIVYHAYLKEQIGKMADNVDKEKEYGKWLSLNKISTEIGIGDPLFLESRIRIDKDRGRQDMYVKSLKDRYELARRKEEEDKTDKSRRETISDIYHMIGPNLNEIVACANAMKGLSAESAKNSECIIANIDHIKGIHSAFGTDFESYTPEYKAVRINSFILGILDTWKKISIRCFDLDYDTSLKSDQEIDIDDNLFSIMIESILENARRHAFCKEDKEENLVKIHSSLSDDGSQVVITFSNNGRPLPEDFTLEGFISKNITFGGSGNTGIGGYHIGKCVESHNGSLDVYSGDDGFTVVEIRIPIDNQ